MTTATGFFISGLLRCAEYPPENPPKQAMAAGRVLIEKAYDMELDFQQAENETAAIEGLQVQSADPKIDGGFAFALKASTPVQHYNPATTVLAIQALQMWEQAAAGSFREGWETLI